MECVELVVAGCSDLYGSQPYSSVPVNMLVLKKRSLSLLVFMQDRLGPNLLKFLSSKIKMSPVQRQLNPLRNY